LATHHRYACVTAFDGEEAWSMLQQNHADVVVSDWRMPRMDGVELCKRIRAREEGAYTYFVLMTDFGDKAHFLEGMNAGADDYHAKPIDIDELQARLVAELTDGDDASDDWLRRADHALLQTKASGRNRVEVAPSSSRLAMFERDRTP
jgi:PleD family two-component response regulator